MITERALTRAYNGVRTRVLPQLGSSYGRTPVLWGFAPSGVHGQNPWSGGCKSFQPPKTEGGANLPFSEFSNDLTVVA